MTSKLIFPDMEIKLDNYGPIISSQEIGSEIYDKVKNALSQNESIAIDLGKIKTMATFCAKQIFGALYLELTPEIFFDKIKLINVNDDLKLIIRLGILSALQNK